MLVLSRKKNESIVINNDITIVVVEIRGDKVRLGVEAPKEVPVHRREVYDAHPWVAASLYKAFCAAQRAAYASLDTTAALKAMLPWLTAHLEEARALMGEDYWSYGFHANRHVLETFLRYHHEQGLSSRRLAPEELFAPETLEQFRI